jgi:TPR repeat protein
MDALRLAAEAGDAEAMSDLGATYAVGSEGLPQDDPEAFRWFTRSAEAGSSLAKLNLAGCYRDGRGCDVDDARAMALYVEAASNPSDPAACDAMERVGEAYRTGTCGVAVDHAEAARWYRRGAEAGSVECAYRRGVCLATGEGVEVNVQNAAEAFRVAAASGHAGAALDYGHCLMRGIGVAVDKKRACRLYAAAADAGHAEAMFHLGMAHLQGRGATQQERLAAKWLLAAAEAGHPQAMLEYARMAATGAPPGFAKDVNAATSWYARAADAGVAEAAAALGAAHCAGIEGHVARDLNESKSWFELALRLGMPEAESALAQVAVETEKDKKRRDALDAHDAAWRLFTETCSEHRTNPEIFGSLLTCSSVPVPDEETLDALVEAGRADETRERWRDFAKTFGAAFAPGEAEAAARRLAAAASRFPKPPVSSSRAALVSEAKRATAFSPVPEPVARAHVARKPRPQPRAETVSRPAAAEMSSRASRAAVRDDAAKPAPKPPVVPVKAPSQGGSGRSKKPKDAIASHPDSPYAAPVARRKK